MQVTIIPLSPDDIRRFIHEAVERTVGRQSTTVDQPKYIPIPEAAQRHGVSKSYLYRLSSDRAISTRRVGKSIQFDVQELEDHFNKTAKRSKTAIDADLKANGVFPTLKGKRHE